MVTPRFFQTGAGFSTGVAGVSLSGVYAGSLDSKETKHLTTGSSGIFVPPSVAPQRSRLEAGRAIVWTWEPSSSPAISIPIADGVWVRGNVLGGFSVSQNGVLAYRRAIPPPPNELTWHDRQGKRLGTVGEPGIFTNPALSPDGKRLAVGRLDPAAGTRDIWVVDLARGVSSRFTFDKADDLNPVWSPDGSRIAFTSDRNGQRDIYWKAAGGASAEELVVETKEGKSLEGWSADGKLLLFNVDTSSVHAAPTSGDRKPFRILQAPFAQIQSHFSPDGRWIAYASVESGRPEVFVQSFPPSGGKWQVSRSGGTEPAWRQTARNCSS